MYTTNNRNRRFAGFRRLLPIHGGIRQLQANNKRQVGSIQGSLVLLGRCSLVQHNSVGAQCISNFRQTWPGKHFI